MIFDGKCTIRNEDMDWNEVTHLSYVAVSPAKDAFTMNGSTQDW